MVTLPKKTLALLCVGCMLAGGMLSHSEVISPKPDRPVLSAIARFAKTALWFMAFAEQPPEDLDQRQHVQSVLVDENGYVHVNHSRGW